MGNDNSSRLAGIGAALLTVLIWAGWIVATRHSVTSHLGPVDVGILRYSVPTVLLAPVWWKVGLLPAGVPKWVLALILSGSGAPFLLVGSLGMSFAPAAHAGALMPGTMPLWAGLIAWALLGERLGKAQTAGYAFIALGIVLIGGAEILAGTGTAWMGDLLFILAASMWAAYTHAFKRSALTAFQAAAVVSVWSLAIHLGLAVVLGSRLDRVPAADLALQTVVQGGLSGFVAILGYGFAVQRLGSTTAAAFSALVPALAALGGNLLLGEAIRPLDLTAAVIVGLGVALATGLWQRQR
ncbi:MAG TPA: DMT family transporter [Azospirillaceae bacterium]|nr:DMT family transporter [Azospirillaceae bacterium]